MFVKFAIACGKIIKAVAIPDADISFIVIPTPYMVVNMTIPDKILTPKSAKAITVASLAILAESLK